VRKEKEGRGIMGEKLSCAICNRKIKFDGLSDKATKCKGCSGIFCDVHTHWSNHNCSAHTKEEIETIKKETKSSAIFMSFVWIFGWIGLIVWYLFLRKKYPELNITRNYVLMVSLLFWTIVIMGYLYYTFYV